MRVPSIIPFLLAVLLPLAACDGGGTGAQEGGEYRAVLRSPNGAEGAAAFELTGPGIESVSPAGGRLFARAWGTTLRVVVVNEPAAAVEFRVTMAQGQAPPAVRVVEVVDGDDLPRASLAGYTVTFHR